MIGLPSHALDDFVDPLLACGPADWQEVGRQQRRLQQWLRDKREKKGGEQPVKIRAKMYVAEVTHNGYSERVKLHAVFGGDKNAEDNTFAKATPSAMCEMQIDNEKAHGVMKPGQKFYVDFTPIEEPAAA